MLLGACATTDQQYGDPVIVDERIIKSEPVEDNKANDQFEGDTASPIQNYDINAQRAEQYSQQVGQGTVSESINAALNAAELYIQANNASSAKRQLNLIDVPLMNQQQSNRYQIIAAYIYYTEQNTEQALQQLNQFLSSPQSQDINARTQRVDALLLSSLCHQRLGSSEAAIAALIQRESILNGAAKTETSRYIWQVIESIPETQRTEIIANTNNIAVRRRLEQSQHGQIAVNNDSPNQFKQWREPNSTQTTNAVKAQWSSASPRTIAILLPNTSRFAKAAQAVTDGINYQHSLNQSSFTPRLNFYDIGANPAQIGQYYTAALQQGADFIIGPLGKIYADQLSNQFGANFPVSTLLLGGDLALGTNAFRLAMSPERESFNVAKRAAASGHVNAAILAPDTATGKRSVDAFQQAWLANGGRVSNIISYSNNQFDHSSELKMLFGLNQSQQRHYQLSKALGFKPKFAPYRRNDIDFVYMVANDKTGRLVRPQINFFGGTSIPVFAQSGVYNGIQDATNNRDLDNTAFPVMPWVLASSQHSPYAGTLNKLFAIGADSYQLAASMNLLSRSPGSAISGNTGTLSLDDNGEVFYQPAWAYFKQGEAVADISSQALLEATGLDINTLHERSKRILNKDHSNNKTYDDSNWDRRDSRRR